MTRRPSAIVTAVLVVAMLGAACTSDRSTESGSSSRLLELPLPEPVVVAQEPTMAIADPAFEPLAGAKAHFGKLGASSYRIEIPDHWNGTLVMWMHGFGSLQPEVKVDAPDFRRHLIDNGIAWAASSFSSTSMIPGVAADETAALWDFFVEHFRRPRWTYVTGLSMGGWAAHIAAERYANRYDGALALCGAAGTEPGLAIAPDQVVAAAYVVGVTQADLDASNDPVRLLDERVRPELDRPATRARVLDLIIAMTGGPRRFAREGLSQELTTNWERARLLIAARLVPPRTRPFELVGVSPEAAQRFNGLAVRFPTDPSAYERFSAGMEVTGRLAIPLLTLHSTGDGQVPIGQALLLRARVEGADQGARLVQRVIEDSGHCGFTTAEQEAAFDDLRRWVEKGTRPAGTDLSNGDLEDLDRTFELQPRRTGAGDTIRVTADATLDGERFSAEFVGAVVIDHGLVTPCQAGIPVIVNGHIDLPVLTADAAAGCARQGAEIVLWTYRGDQKLFSNRIPVRTLADIRARTVAFDSTEPRARVPETNDIHGEVFDAAGIRIPKGRVEARIDGALCGVASVRDQGSFNGFILSVLVDAGRCPAGARVDLTVDGRPATPTITNTDHGREAVDLTVNA